MHTSSSIRVCAYAHIKQSVPVCADQCVGALACLYLYLVINLIALKGPLSLFSVASDHWGHSLILELVKLYTLQCKSFYIRCKVYQVCSFMYVS